MLNPRPWKVGAVSGQNDRCVSRMAGGEEKHGGDGSRRMAMATVSSCDAAGKVRHGIIVRQPGALEPATNRDGGLVGGLGGSTERRRAAQARPGTAAACCEVPICKTVLKVRPTLTKTKELLSVC